MATASRQRNPEPNLVSKPDLQSDTFDCVTSPLGGSTTRLSTRFGEFRLLSDNGEVPFVAYDRIDAYCDLTDKRTQHLAARYLIIPTNIDINNPLALELLAPTVRFVDYDVISDEWEAGWIYRIYGTDERLGISLRWSDDGQALRQPIANHDFPTVKYQAGKTGMRSDARFLIAWGTPKEDDDISIWNACLFLPTELSFSFLKKS